MIDRYEPIDWYKDNRPKTFRDNETGEEISLHEYRKRRRAAASIDEADPDEQDDELETQAFADPAPRPRLFDVSQTDTEQERTGRSTGVRRMGIAEMLAPALTGVAQSAFLFRLRHSPRQVFIPPREVTTPILAPLGRIVDRHLPVEFAMLMGEDGKDVSAAMQGLGAAIVWFNEALRQYEEYKEREREYYAAADSRPNRNTPQAPDDSAANWSGDIIERVRRGNGSGRDSLAYRGDAANGSTNGGAVRELSGAEAVSRIGDLLRADAEGAMRRGLVDQ